MKVPLLKESKIIFLKDQEDYRIGFWVTHNFLHKSNMKYYVRTQNIFCLSISKNFLSKTYI